MQIYHRKNSSVDLLATDFDQKFIVRKFCGLAAIRVYATLRVAGHDAPSSFIAAFGNEFYGHPDHIAIAAERFETTIPYMRAAEEVTEALGEERIKEELAARCDEVGAFTQSHAMQHRVEQFDFLQSNTNEFTPQDIVSRQDDEAYKEFADARYKLRMKEAHFDRLGTNEIKNSRFLTY